MLPARMLRRLPLRLRLPFRLTEFFFLRVPLRETLAAPRERWEAREEERWMAVSPSRMEEPRTLASKSSLKRPTRGLSGDDASCGCAGESAKSDAADAPYPRARWSAWGAGTELKAIEADAMRENWQRLGKRVVIGSWRDGDDVLGWSGAAGVSGWSWNWSW